MIRPRGIRWLVARALLVFGSGVIGLSLFEFVVATFDVAPPRRASIVVWTNDRDAKLNDRDSPYRFHPGWMWEPRPGAEEFGSAINEQGYRGPLYPRERGEGRLRVCVLGDSSTYGVKMVESLAWPRVMEARLRLTGIPADVLNFGVTGFTSLQGLALYRHRVREYKPDIVVIAFGACNDGFPPPSNLPDREKIERISSLPYRAQIFFRRYDSFRFLEGLFGGAPKRGANVGDRGTQRVPLDQFEQALQDFDDAVRADGARLVIVSPPRRRDREAKYAGLVSYTEVVERVAKKRAVLLVDVRAAFRMLEDNRFGESAEDLDVAVTSPWFIDDVHPSPEGHRVYAARIITTMREEGILPALTDEGE